MTTPRSAEHESTGGKGPRSELGAVSQALLRCATSGGSRTEFLREASGAILRFTGTADLDLWIEDGDRRYHWRAVARPVPSSALTSLPAPGTAAGEETAKQPPRHPPEESLLEQALRATGDRDRELSSASRTSRGSLWSKTVAVVPFEIDGGNQGVLRIHSGGARAFTRHRVGSYEGVAQLLGLAIANRRAQRALDDRVKELGCVYRIARIASDSDLSLDDALRAVVDLLPPAMQYPTITTTRITLGERSFCSRGFDEGPHRLSADILIRGTAHGRLEVFYVDRDGVLDQTRILGGPPFVEEEHNLVQGVARELSFIIERKRAEEEERRLQEQIRHADRLATIGQLAAGVAHELNEPLGNILGFAQLAEKDPDLPEQTGRDIHKIVNAALFAREIIKKLMIFSRQTPSRMSDTDLNKVVDDGVQLIESRCTQARVVVLRNLAPELPLVRGDRAQLMQVLVNLMVNAVQAMPEGGELRLSTKADCAEVCVHVEDTGVGIPPADLDNIFLPFFTTKDVGQGTGLGLSVVHGIASTHHGGVSVDSEVGRGTRFEVRLPAASAASGTEGDDG